MNNGTVVMLDVKGQPAHPVLAGATRYAQWHPSCALRQCCCIKSHCSYYHGKCSKYLCCWTWHCCEQPYQYQSTPRLTVAPRANSHMNLPTLVPDGCQTLSEMMVHQRNMYPLAIRGEICSVTASPLPVILWTTCRRIFVYILCRIFADWLGRHSCHTTAEQRIQSTFTPSFRRPICIFLGPVCRSEACPTSAWGTATWYLAKPWSSASHRHLISSRIFKSQVYCDNGSISKPWHFKYWCLV